MPKSRPTPPPAPVNPPPAAPAPAVGEKTIILRAPADLAEWAQAQARKEGTNLSEKLRAYLRQWQADVQAADAAAVAARQAEIDAAVQAALKKGKAKKAPARKTGATPKVGKATTPDGQAA